MNARNETYWQTFGRGTRVTKLRPHQIECLKSITETFLNFDPCDDCADWAGSLPYVDVCPDCGEQLDYFGKDEHDTTRCSVCASEKRDDSWLSHCCNAELTTQTIATCERHGEINDDYYYCSGCEQRQE